MRFDPLKNRACPDHDPAVEEADFWSVTGFGEPRMDAYALALMEGETRSGLRTLSLVFLFILSASAVLNTVLGLSGPYLYTYLALAVLAVHVYLTARTVQNIKALHLLGMSLLVVSSTGLVLGAHQVGQLGVPLYLGVVLIFVVIPLIPWGLREALSTVTLVYALFSLSTLMRWGRFEFTTLLLLQFFMLCAGLIVLILVARNARVRKQEIRSLFELETAHDAMRELSYRDPLTGAWNRRYLQEHYEILAEGYRQRGKPFYFIIFDLNHFKKINDSYGHDYGDQVLQWVIESFSWSLAPDDLLVRLGGDEFAMVLGDDPRTHIDRGLEVLDGLIERQGHEPVSISFGKVRVAPQRRAPLEEIYRKADGALYAAKTRRGNAMVEAPLSDLEGAIPTPSTKEAAKCPA